MRSLLGKSAANAYFRGSLLAIILLLSLAHRGDDALGQGQSPSPPTQAPSTGPGSGRPPFGEEMETHQDPFARHAMEQAAKLRNVERQKKLVADSSQIVRLADELSAGVEPKEKDPTSTALSKKAEEVEKLARSVKELMKAE